MLSLTSLDLTICVLDVVSENSILFLVEWKLGIEIENSRIVYEVNLDAMKREMEIMR